MFFFLFVFAIMDFSWMMFNQMSVQDAVREAARYAATGNNIAGSSRVQSIEQILTQTAVGTQVQSIVISNSGNAGVCNSTSLPATPNSCAGGPGDVVNVTANCAVPLLTNVFGAFFSGDKFTFAVSASFKNEPFPSAQTN
jgi:Flp pilus assembly protein TadG